MTSPPTATKASESRPSSQVLLERLDLTMRRQRAPIRHVEGHILVVVKNGDAYHMCSPCLSILQMLDEDYTGSTHLPSSLMS